jgi:transcriptional regulator with XRE-family HTH domain
MKTLEGMSSSSPSPSSSAYQARAILAANLIRLRTKRLWSQEALAFESGLHRTFIAHVERQARNISLDNIERLAQALGVEPFQLLQAPDTDER